jgi:hypothetical protein
MPSSKIDVGIGTLPYLLFQFTPIILLGVFLLMSLLHQDIRAAVYSAGLLIAITSTVLIGKALPPSSPSNVNRSFLLAAGTPPGTTGVPLSPHLSLNLVMYAFTFTYFLTGMIQHNAVKENAPTITFFTILIAAELLWRWFNGDKDNVGKETFFSLVAIVIGFVVGLLWAGIIISTKNKSLLYLVGMNTRETCTATKQKMTCKRVSR